MTAALNLPERVWTVDDVARLPEDLPYELIDGWLIWTPSPLPFHQFIGVRLATALELACPENVLVTVDQSVLVDFRNEPRPDVVILREEGADRRSDHHRPAVENHSRPARMDPAAGPAPRCGTAERLSAAGALPA